MTAATGRVGVGIKPFGADDPIPWGVVRPLAASVSPFRNWLLAVDSNGRLTPEAANTPDLKSAGFSDQDQEGSATAGLATNLVRQQFVSGFPNSTASLDAILDSDYAVACWAVDNQTVGKLSHVAGSNRSLLGVAFGLDPDNNTPIVYPGPIGWLLGRAALAQDNALAGSYVKAIDSGATNDLSEDLIPRTGTLHGKVAAAYLDVSGTTLAATGATNIKTLTISKRDGAGGAAVVVATLDTSVTAMTQWTSVPFVLSAVAGATNLLETDLLTIQESHAAGGGIIPAGTIRVVMKVQ